MSARTTKDPVNQELIEAEDQWGLESLGMMNSTVWRNDPKRLVFTLARYKFVAKMLSGRKRVLEIGCGDGFASRLVRQEVEHLTITDYDPLFIKAFQERASDRWPTDARVLDILSGPTDTPFDAIYSLDVMEHIESKLEATYLKNVGGSLRRDGVAIIGMPSLESQSFASPASKAGHVNCKSGVDFRASLETTFENVFLFSMNDEIVHTGFAKMAHYLLGLCVGVKQG